MLTRGGSANSNHEITTEPAERRDIANNGASNFFEWRETNGGSGRLAPPLPLPRELPPFDPWTNECMMLTNNCLIACVTHPGPLTQPSRALLELDGPFEVSGRYMVLHRWLEAMTTYL